MSIYIGATRIANTSRSDADWMGTRVEYQALVASGAIDQNLIYYTTDDDEYQAANTGLASQSQVNALIEVMAGIIDDTAVSAQDSTYSAAMIDNKINTAKNTLTLSTQQKIDNITNMITATINDAVVSKSSAYSSDKVVSLLSDIPRKHQEVFTNVVANVEIVINSIANPGSAIVQLYKEVAGNFQKMADSEFTIVITATEIKITPLNNETTIRVNILV